MVEQHYKKYWCWPQFTLTPAKHEQLAKEARNWNRNKMQGKGQYLLLKEKKENVHRVQASWSSLWSLWLLATKATKLTEQTSIHMGKATSYMRFCGSPGLKEIHLNRYTYEQTHRPTSGPHSQCSQWLLWTSYKTYKIYKTAVSLYENRSDLVEITWNAWNIPIYMKCYLNYSVHITSKQEMQWITSKITNYLNLSQELPVNKCKNLFK